MLRFLLAVFPHHRDRRWFRALHWQTADLDARCAYRADLDRRIAIWMIM